MSADRSADEEWSQPEWFAPPRDEIPALSPMTRVLATTEQTAVVLLGVRVYATGVELRIDRRARRLNEGDDEWHGVIKTFLETPNTPAGHGGEQALIYATQIDGGDEVLANNLFRPHTPARNRPEPYSLMRVFGNGSGNTTSCECEEGLWIWPLPDGDTLGLSVRWPAMSLPEVRTQIDLREVIDLALQSRPLWPARP